MFDWYEPDGLSHCPSCGLAVDGWQGKDGPCTLHVYRQGHKHPVEHRVDDDARADVPFDDHDLLPAAFGFYTDCANSHWIDATGYCDESGVWVCSKLDAS
jgi:hypothetical protein